MADADQQLQEICDHVEITRDDYRRAFAVVHRKFKSVGCGESKSNPTEEELRAASEARVAWENAVRRLRDYAKANV